MQYYNKHVDRYGLRKIYCSNCEGNLFKWQIDNFKIFLVDGNKLIKDAAFKTGRNILVECGNCKHLQHYEIPWRLWDRYERDWIDERN